jgi:hypothetical protein
MNNKKKIIKKNNKKNNKNSLINKTNQPVRNPYFFNKNGLKYL